MPNQSRIHSLLETLSSIAIGFVVSLGITAVVLPAYGLPVTWGQNFEITAIFTRCQYRARICGGLAVCLVL